MIARNRNIITHLVHQFDNLTSHGYGAEHLAVTFELVAVIHKEHFAAFLLKFLTDAVKSGISEALLRTAVNVAGGKDNDIIALFPGL